MRKWTFLALLVLMVGLSGAAAAPPPSGSARVRLQLVASGLTAPVFLTEVPDGSGRLFVLDQIGLIRIITPDDGLLPDPFLDLTGQLVPLSPGFDERGLLGLAFHPDYAANGRFFVYYNAPLRAGAPPDFNNTATFSEFQVSADPNLADPASEQIFLEVDDPQFNHNGGTLAFGPDDGYLYISLGDGGGANDVGLGHVEDWYPDNEGGNGQDITENLLGSILRLDVDSGAPYAIPPDNPFVGVDGLDEIYAYGFRNPYRFSFDMGGDHMLLAGDVGQNLWEEVSVVVSGGNYGWNVREGTHCFDTSNPNVSPPTCPDEAPGGVPLRDPVIEYANARSPGGGLGIAVVGGYIYRGDDIRAFHGRYVFGDWSTGFTTPDGSLFVAQPHNNPRKLWRFKEILFQHQPDGRLGHFLLAFGQDSTGEMYLLTTDMTGPAGDTGRVYRLRPPGPPN